jgi:hypothetical protein
VRRGLSGPAVRRRRRAADQGPMVRPQGARPLAVHRRWTTPGPSPRVRGAVGERPHDLELPEVCGQETERTSRRRESAGGVRRGWWALASGSTSGA